jgi:uncharacterized protein (DUF488 family)
MAQRTLFTVGHSTRSWPEFIALLKAWDIEILADVRTVPQSRAFPWFSKQKMQSALPAAGIQYVHLPALGGLRRAKKDSVNTGWRNDSFRGFADYMQTAEFQQGLRELNELRRAKRTCIMCSEAVWWRCHRRMIADALVGSIPVKHIMSVSTAKRHELTSFAKVRKKQGRPPIIMYPETQAKQMARR